MRKKLDNQDYLKVGLITFFIIFLSPIWIPTVILLYTLQGFGWLLLKIPFVRSFYEN